MNVAHAARLFLRSQHAGILSTVSARLAGYPFGSVVPFALDARARPVLLVSALAESIIISNMSSSCGGWSSKLHQVG